MKGATFGFGAAFLVSGIASTMLGPLMPGLEARWHMGDERAGLLFASLAIASVAVAVFAGKIAQRFGFAAMVLPGLLLMGAAVTGIAAAPSWSIAMLCAAGIGAGLGLVIPAGNLGIAELYPGKAAGQLMVLNLAWCSGALIAPLCVQSMGRGFLYLLTGAIALAGILSVAIPRVHPVGRGPEGPQPSSRMKAAAILISFLVFCYSGTENAISGWMPTLAHRTGGTGQLWAVLPSVFWLAMFTGRAASPILLLKMTPAQLAKAGLFLGFAGTLVLLIGHTPLTYLAAGAVCGLGFAPVFPAVIAQLAPGEVRNPLSGVVFASANLGSATIPLAVGYVSAKSGTLHASLAILLPLFAVMLWLQVRLARGKQAVNA